MSVVSIRMIISLSVLSQTEVLSEVEDPQVKGGGNLWVLTSHPSGEISDDIRGTQIHAQPVPVDLEKSYDVFC